DDAVAQLAQPLLRFVAETGHGLHSYHGVECPQQEVPMLRRNLLGASIAAAALPALAKAAPARPVRLSSNENPFGPSAAALAAMREACSRTWIYPDDAVAEMRAAVAKFHGVTPDFVQLGDGSAEILRLAAGAFTGPGRKLVTADPT